MFLKKYIILIIFCIPLLSDSQIIQNEICGFENHNITFLKKPWKNNNDYLYNFLDSCQYDSTIKNILYKVPVKFWIYRRSNGKDGITLTDMKDHIRYLNYYHSINNTGFRFYLRPDFEYIDNDRLYKLNYISQAPFQSLIRRSKGCVNIYVAEKIKRNKTFSINRNYSGTYNALTKGVIIARGGSNSTLSHEIGHYFGLKHPHKYWKTKFKQEPVSRTRTIRGSNIKMCERKGDGLCDTPAEPNLSRYTDDNCRYTGWNVKDKYGDVYKPATNNIMSYTKNRNCRVKFTAGQKAIMLITASRNKYADAWSTQSENAQNFDFDYYEPDDAEEIASEIFFNTPQTHTFHLIYTGKRKTDFIDHTDWLYFTLNTTKAQDLTIKISSSEYKFTPITVSVFKHNKLIKKASVLNASLNSTISLQNIKPGKYYLKIETVFPQEQITGYKINVEK